MLLETTNMARYALVVAIAENDLKSNAPEIYPRLGIVEQWQ